jgi:hypothetical protein
LRRRSDAFARQEQAKRRLRETGAGRGYTAEEGPDARDDGPWGELDSRQAADRALRAAEA